MSTDGTNPLHEALYELFCSIRPFPRERMDWIAWLVDFSAPLPLVMGLKVPGVSGDIAGRRSAAVRITELLYGLDKRGYSPWESEHMRTAPTSHAHLIDADAARVRAQNANQVLQELVDTASRSLEHMKEMRTLANDCEAICGLAGALEYMLAETVGLTVDGLIKSRILQAAHTARQLVKRLQAAPDDPHPSSAAFHAHLDACAQCRDHPFSLCDVGRGLLVTAAAAPVPPSGVRARRVGTEPHHWVEQAPLKSGLMMYFCDRCQRSIAPKAEKVAEALAIHDCTGRVH